MMGKLVITKLHINGFNEIRKSSGVTNMCKQIAEQKYATVNGTEGYALEERNYPDRNGFAIIAKDYPAIQENLDSNTLEKLIK